MKNSLSVIIITKNEAHDIQQCLDSVAWANEIIVLDSGSIDNTVEICRRYTDKVFETDWPGFGIQKNRALEKATHEWVLSIDADETVNHDLQQEILSTINSPEQDYAAYEIPRQSIYCGKLIKYGAWHQKAVIRLFKREKGRFDDAIVHENLIIDGKIGKLTNALIHYTYRNLDEMLEKMNLYSTLSAQRKNTKGKKGSLRAALLHGFWAFFRSYFLQRGFLDGKFGFMLAISNAEYAYYTYLKLMLLCHPERRCHSEQREE